MSKSAVEAAYQKQARHYDLALKFYGWIGLRIGEYRARAIELLALKPGDRVVDLGCGTGLSFAPILEKFGRDGRIVGVDLSSRMLDCARDRVRRAGWMNVELVYADIVDYVLPQDVNCVFSTGVFGYVSERDRVIHRVAQALVPGGRLAIVDGKRPDAWPRWLFRTFVRISKPFGLTEAYFDARTWESIERWFTQTTFQSIYGGLLYVASGAAPDREVVR